MRQSQLFTKTQRFAPKDEVSRNAELLIRAGYVHKEMAGVYAYLPLGLRVMQRIMGIIREEMNAIGGQEVMLTTLQRREVWEQTNRWDDAVVDNWFKTRLITGSEVGLGFTHEEVITAMMTTYVSSYKDLPFAAYQFQTKFRNEARAKSGIMRGREFIMKDLYSFNRTIEAHETFYELTKQAYVRIFAQCGIGAQTYFTFASGGTFSRYSHEYQTVCDAGEDIIYVHEEKGIAINEEVYTDEVLADLGVARDELVQKKSAEVGNIFSLGTRFSDAFGLTYRDEDGQVRPVIMGSYGIGPARLMGLIVELLADERGLVWPDSVAPYHVHLIDLNSDGEAKRTYDLLTAAGIDVLWDDRDVRAGEKFTDSDLLGLPWRVVVSAKSLAGGGVEIQRRTNKEGVIVPIDELATHLRRA